MTLLATDSMQVALQTEDNYVQTKLKALIKTNNIINGANSMHVNNVTTTTTTTTTTNNTTTTNGHHEPNANNSENGTCEVNGTNENHQNDEIKHETLPEYNGNENSNEANKTGEEIKIENQTKETTCINDLKQEPNEMNNIVSTTAAEELSQNESIQISVNNVNNDLNETPATENLLTSTNGVDSASQSIEASQTAVIINGSTEQAPPKSDTPNSALALVATTTPVVSASTTPTTTSASAITTYQHKSSVNHYSKPNYSSYRQNAAAAAMVPYLLAQNSHPSHYHPYGSIPNYARQLQTVPNAAALQAAALSPFYQQNPASQIQQPVFLCRGPNG